MLENLTIDFYLDEDDLPIELIIDYVNRIDNRLVFQIKDGYKLELQTPGKMKLLGSTKELVGKTKNGENVPSLELVEVVLVKVSQKSEVLYTFTPNKSHNLIFIC